MKIRTELALLVAFAVMGSMLCSCVNLGIDSSDEETAEAEATAAAKEEPGEPAKKPPRNAKIVPIAQKDISGLREVAEKFADDILLGMKNKDYKRFVRNLRETNITQKQFDGMMTKFKEDKGTYPGVRHYMGELQRGPVWMFVWKVRFDKTIVNKGEEVPVEVDTLFRVVVGEVDEKYYIVAFGFN